MITRRNFVRRLSTAGGFLATHGISDFSRLFPRQSPVRVLTHLPGYHWFGYYDKLQFSPDDRYVLGMETKIDGRTPQADDSIGVGMIDTELGDRWIEFGTSTAWGWQQGCMLQWRPPDSNEVLWNDREDGPEGSRFVTRVLDVVTGAQRALPRPIYALSPDGQWAIGADFSRIQRLRPGYGYQGIPDPYADQRAPRDGGIYRMDLDTGESELIVSIAEVAAISYEREDLSEATHYFNHLLVSPTGDRLIFLHRWRQPENSAYATSAASARVCLPPIRTVLISSSSIRRAIPRTSSGTTAIWQLRGPGPRDSRPVFTGFAIIREKLHRLVKAL